MSRKSESAHSGLHLRSADRFVGFFTDRGVFYGYVVLVFATVGKIFTSPGQSPCIGVAITPIRESLDMSRSKVTLLYLIATLTSAVALPFTTGIAIDRYGPRVCVVLIALGLSLGCYVTSTANSAAHLLVAFFLLRYMGQGSLMNVSVTEINLWWVAKRGKAMGVAGAVVSLAMLAAVPAFMEANISSGGWRKTYQKMGLILLICMAPLGGIFYRNTPKQLDCAQMALPG